MNPTALQRLLPLNAGAVRVHGGPEEMPYDDVRGKGWTLTSCDGDIFITIDALSDPMPHDRITIARNLAYAAEAIANLSCTACPLGAYLRAVDQIRDIVPVEDLT